MVPWQRIFLIKLLLIAKNLLPRAGTSHDSASSLSENWAAARSEAGRMLPADRLPQHRWMKGTSIWWIIMHNIRAPEMKILSKIILCVRVWKMPFNPERGESMGRGISSKRVISHWKKRRKKKEKSLSHGKPIWSNMQCTVISINLHELVTRGPCADVSPGGLSQSLLRVFQRASPCEHP